MMIPTNYKDNFCNSQGVIDCDYVKNKNCPGTCNYAININRNEKLVKIKSGRERFLNKFGIDYHGKIKDQQN